MSPTVGGAPGGFKSVTHTMEGCHPDVLTFTAKIDVVVATDRREFTDTFSITSPPCGTVQSVHVEAIDGFFEVVDSEIFELTFLVEVADQDHSLISGEPVTVTVIIVGPEGFTRTLDALTDLNGIAEFAEFVSESGVYIINIDELSGDGVEYEFFANSLSTYDIEVDRQDYVEVRDDTGRILAEIPIDWGFLTESSDGPEPALFAAPDISAWRNSLDTSDSALISGMLAVILDDVTAEAFTVDELLDSIADPEDLPDNCQQFLTRNDYSTSTSLEYAEHVYECEEGGLLVVGVQYDPATPASLMLLLARMITEEDEIAYTNFTDTLVWEPVVGDKLQVHIGEPYVDFFKPLNVGPDDFTLDFSVEVVDSNNNLVSGVTVSGFYEDPNGNTFPFEITEQGDAIPAILVPVTQKGIYTFTVTGVTGPIVSYSPSLNESGTSADVLVQAYFTDEILFTDGGLLDGTLSVDYPETWAAISKSGEIPTFFAARDEDIATWMSHVEFEEGAISGAGLSVQVLQVPGGSASVDQAFLEAVLDAEPAPLNCADAHGRSFSPEEIVDTYGCDSGGTYYNIVRYDPSTPDVYLLVQASIVGGRDFNIFRRFVDTVSWQPGGRQGTVRVSEVTAAFYNDLDGEVTFAVAVEDSNGEFAFEPVATGFYQDPLGNVFDFETTPTGPTDIGTTIILPADLAGVYTFTLVDVFVAGATYDPNQDEAGPTFQAVVNPGFDINNDPTVHLFNATASKDEETDDLVFVAVVRAANGDLVFAPVVRGFFQTPSGEIFGFDTVPVGQDEVGTSFTIAESDVEAGAYTFTVTHILVEGAGYNPDANETEPIFLATIRPCTYCVYLANAKKASLGIEVMDTICVLCNADFIAATGGVCRGVMQKPQTIEIMDQRGSVKISLILQKLKCTNCPRPGKEGKFNFVQ